MQGAQNKYRWILPVLTGMLLTGLILFYYGLVMMPHVSQSITDCFFWIRGYYGLKRVALFLILGGAVGYAINRWGEKIGNFLFRYRWWVGCAVVVIGVIFKLNGSSIGVLSEVLPQGKDLGILLGRSRAMRPDEYSVFTPMAIAQYNQGFPYFGTAFRAATTDMFGVYGQPVMNLLVLFRPFQIGYLFLPLEYGFSFYWVARLVALFLVSFEMGLILCREKRLLALTYASLVTFSPWIAWWFSINCFVEQMIFGQLLVIWLRQYLLTDNQKKRWGYIIGLSWAAVTYALTLYPTTEIPLVYIFGSLGIWQALSVWKKDTLNWRQDGLRLLAACVIIGASLGYFFMKSSETISLVNKTIYPGQNENMWPLNKIFGTWVYGLFLTIQTDAWNIPNPVELASFFCLAPLGLILSGIGLWKEKKIFTKENSGFLLLILFLVLFALCRPFEKATIIAKVLLLQKRTLRLYALMTYIDLLLLFMALGRNWGESKRTVWIGFVGSIVLTTLVWMIPHHLLKQPLPSWITVGTILALLVAFFGAIAGLKRKKIQSYWCVFMIVLAVLMGGCVNPIRSGMETILENPAYLAAKEAGESEGIWIVDKADQRLSNILAAGGAPVINTTNAYPVLDRWEEVLGPGHEKIYNRYAHIIVVLQNTQPTHAELAVSDFFRVYLNTKDLKKLDVSRVYSTRDLESLNSEKVQFKKIKDLGGGSIYQVLDQTDK